MSHTPGPLHVARFDQGDAALLSSESKWICLVDVRDEEGYANADRIALCWNMHEELLEALKDAQEVLVDPRRRNTIYANDPLWATMADVIAKATGGAE